MQPLITITGNEVIFLPQTFEFQGKGLDKTIEAALEELKVSREAVDIEVLQAGNPGLLGLGATPTRIQVTLKAKATGSSTAHPLADPETRPAEPVPSETEPKPETADRDGLLSYVNGKLEITPPVGIGRHGVIVPSSMVQVSVNGHPTIYPSPVRPNDKVEIIIAAPPPLKPFEIELSDDHMKAYLMVSPSVAWEYYLTDHEPSNKLELVPSKRTVPAPPVEITEVMKAIHEAGIVFGLDQGLVDETVKAASGEKVTIAQGTPLKEPIDGKAEILFETAADVKPDQLYVDYREMNKIISVEPGNVLARILPPVEGTPGKTVTGEDIPCRPAKTATLTAGHGIRMFDDALVAEVSGRPELKGTTVNMLPILTFNKDITIDSGNVHFHGDVVIHGNVSPGMTIEADGLITIDGVVEQSVITARDGVITLGRVINSVVRAGGAYAARAKLLPVAKQMLTNLEILNEGIQEVNFRMTKDGLSPAPTGRIIHLLITNKLNQIPRLSKELADLCAEKGIELTGDEKKMFELITSLVGFSGQQHAGFDNPVGKVAEMLREWVSDTEIQLHKRSDVYLTYALKSNIFATGKIIVEGQGCLNSALSSGDAVLIKGSPGVFRGGQIQAFADVFVNDAGSDLSLTRIETGENHKIVCSKISGSCMFNLGRLSMRIDEPRGSTVIYLDEDRSIRIR